MVTKRIFDVVASALLLTLTAPVLVAVAVILRMAAGRPVIFQQRRVGKDGRLFTIHKFRTMRTSSSPERGFVEAASRVHSVGAILRAWKLDELPQLWDVLTGSMSLVGPRPELPEYVERWPEDKRAVILKVRPGITDPASIRYRDESAELALTTDPEAHYLSVIMPRKLEMYDEYVRTRSLVGDVRILIQTAFAVVNKPR